MIERDQREREHLARFVAGFLVGACAVAGAAESKRAPSMEQIDTTIAAVIGHWDLEPGEVADLVQEFWSTLRDEAGWFAAWSGRPT